jgi:hypothetical protein
VRSRPPLPSLLPKPALSLTPVALHGTDRAVAASALALVSAAGNANTTQHTPTDVAPLVKAELFDTLQRPRSELEPARVVARLLGGAVGG